jgi:phospholipid/cholesterol/gamma-HCH transport system substrate-binding protein
VLVLAVTLVVIAFVLLRGGGSRYEVRALVESAGQLVKGNLVKVGGVTVGSVKAIDLTSDNQAQITLKIDDAALAALNPALSQARQTTSELIGDQAAFERALVESAGVVESVASRAGDLQAGVANGAQVADAVASEAQSVDNALRRAPEALRKSNTTLAELRSALTGLRPALRDAQPAAPRLANVLRLAQPVVHEAGPVVAQVRDAVPDVTALLLGLPKLDATARPAFASTVGALQGASAVVQAARTYTPDLIGGLMNGFGGSTGPYYDANGHYVRIALAGNITSASNAGSLLPTPPPGAFNEFRQGIVNRCPGAASQPAPDRSNPFDAPEAQCNAKDSP